jgi:Na+-driven multidrug efflux pump
LGTESIAAINISSTVERIAMVIFFGMGNACAVMLGNEIGAGEKERAFDYAKRFAVIGPGIAVFISLIVALGSKQILSVYNVSEEVYMYSTRNLWVFACYLPMKVFNLINVVGVLRSGGDTIFCFLLDTGGVWLIGVPFAFVAGLYWHLPIYWVYALVTSEEVVKMLIGIPRLYSKKWIHNLVNHMES